MHQHSPILCIVPPHMLKEIASKGSGTQRKFALQTMQASARFRGQRNAMADFSALAFRAVSSGKERIVYDAKNGSNLPGTIVRKEGDPPSADVAVNEAYDGSGVTYDLYSNVYSRNSIDANGMRLDSTVHYQKGYDNLEGPFVASLREVRTGRRSGGASLMNSGAMRRPQAATRPASAALGSGAPPARACASCRRPA